MAVLVNNPTYYGICSDLRAISRTGASARMLALADEAHGTHFYFGDGLPVSAMAAGADLAAVSMHKSGGSLTQSSLPAGGARRKRRPCAADHQPDTDDERFLSAAFKPGYFPPESCAPGKKLPVWFLSLPMRARRSTQWAAIMRTGKSLSTGTAFFDFDVTKLSQHRCPLGWRGIEVYDILRDEYDIR